jgi:hypothetical protein
MGMGINIMSIEGNSGPKETITVIDETLHESRHEIGERRVTGRQIVEAADKHPPDDFYVLYRPEQGGLRELAEDEGIELGHGGTSRFYVIKGDRLYRFEIDGIQCEWPISPISGAVLYVLAGADPHKLALWTTGGDEPHREIALDDSVDLEKPGVEKFVLKPREPEYPTIFINDKPHVVKQDNLNGAQLRALGSIESDYQLFLEKPGDDVPIPNDKSVKIENQQHFYSLPPATFG